MINSIVAGNWKMNKTPKEGKIFIEKMISDLDSLGDTNVIICPPFTGLTSLSNSNKYNLGAQNCYFEDSGAYTGEISVEMLIDCGVKYVILGHSERRSIFSEDDISIGKKVKKVLDAGVTPILCIGETIDQLNEGLAKETVSAQLNEGLSGLSSLENIVIAYEPVWAIGTGETATSVQAQEMHVHIRSVIASKYGGEVADGISIIYGGSCKPSNAHELFFQTDVDGGLIGGASLNAEDFISIIKA